MSPDNRPGKQLHLPVPATEADEHNFAKLFEGTALDNLPPGQGGKEIVATSIDADALNNMTVNKEDGALIKFLRRLAERNWLGSTHSSRTAEDYEK